MSVRIYSLKKTRPVNACSNPVGHGFILPVMKKIVVITCVKNYSLHLLVLINM